MIYQKVNIAEDQTIKVRGSDTLSVFISKSLGSTRTVQAVYSSAGKIESTVVIYVEEIHDVARILLNVLNKIEDIILLESYRKGNFTQTEVIEEKSFTYQASAEYDPLLHRFLVTLSDMEDGDAIAIEAHEITALSTSLLNALSIYDEALASAKR